MPQGPGLNILISDKDFNLNTDEGTLSLKSSSRPTPLFFYYPLSHLLRNHQNNLDCGESLLQEPAYMSSNKIPRKWAEKMDDITINQRKLGDDQGAEQRRVSSMQYAFS